MPELTLVVVAVFTSVALLVGLMTSALLVRVSPERRRLREMSPSAGGTSSVGGTALVNAPVDEAVARLRRIVPKSPKEMTRLQRRLALAGYHGTAPLLVYCLSELLLAAMGFALPLYFLGYPRGVVFGVLAGVVGYLLPAFSIQYRIGLRKKQIQNGLPDVLDLLIVCLEAGLALDQAIFKAAEELEISYPALANELRMVNIETRAGKPRLEALKNFAKRTQVDDVRALVAMLVQTERFGTSVAQALRTHAQVARTKRRQRAEERAAKVGVKLVFPLVFCLFPAFYVVTLGPAVVQFVRVFFGQIMKR